MPAVFRERPPAPSFSAHNSAILLVDDDPGMLVLLHLMLRDLAGNYAIVTASGGAQALAQVALRPVPLVFTDYNMPGLNGIDLTAAIKKDSPETCVVMVTAYATPDLEQRAREVGVDYFLPKPFLLDQLAAIVRVVLR